MQYVMYSTHNTIQSMYFVYYTIQSTSMYTVYCIVYCILYNVHCSLYSIFILFINTQHTVCISGKHATFHRQSPQCSSVFLCLLQINNNYSGRAFYFFSLFLHFSVSLSLFLFLFIFVFIIFTNRDFSRTMVRRVLRFLLPADLRIGGLICYSLVAWSPWFYIFITYL